jgi:DNA-binding transcriptional regulator YhcF (GntR family)
VVLAVNDFQLSTDRRPKSWVDVEKAVLFRIAQDYYAPSQRLPTCDALALELGVNKNTVSKAYRSLVDRGYLRASPGRGTHILKRPTHSDPARALGDLSNLMGLVIQEAKLAGLNHTQFLELIQTVVGRAYGQGQVRIGLVECNAYDAATLSRDVQEVLTCPVEPLLLQDIAGNSAFYQAKFDILAVNLAHLHEFEEVRDGSIVRGGADVVALVVTPDMDSLMQIARLPRASRVGLVCDMEASLQRMKGILSGYNPSILLTGCLAGDAAGMRALAHSVDVVVATPSAYPQVRQTMPDLPSIRITFRIEDRSMQQLAERMRERAHSTNR